MRRNEKTANPYLSGNFAPIRNTLPLTPCSYEGEIPADLAGGQYIRNGSNPLIKNEENTQAHWFDGDGMLSGVLFRRQGDEIQPEFVNQYLVTDVFAFAKSSTLTKPFLFSISILIDPLASVLSVVLHVLRTVILTIFSQLPGSTTPVKKASVANTAVLYHDGRALATCESGPPLRFALPSLETIGWFDGRKAQGESEDSETGCFGGEDMLSWVRQWTTAHPRTDPVTGELIAFHACFIAPFVHYSIIPKSKSNGQPILTAPVPGIKSSKMMHDFGVSRGYTVILDMPLCFNPLNLLKGSPVLSFESCEKSRFGVFPRYRPEAVQWYETNPCSPEVKPIPPEYAEEEQCRLYYYSFPLTPPSSGRVEDHEPTIAHQWALSAIEFEFPSVSPLCTMSEAQFVYGCSARSVCYSVGLGKAAKIDILAKINATALIARGLENQPQPIKGCVDNRSIQDILESDDPDDPIRLFAMPEGWYAQEPRFVPRSKQNSEDDGFLLTFVFDESQLDNRGCCRDDAIGELWVIDARTMRDVVARIKLPQRVPYGFHGCWFSEDEIVGQRTYRARVLTEDEERKGVSAVVWRKARVLRIEVTWSINDIGNLSTLAQCPYLQCPSSIAQPPRLHILGFLSLSHQEYTPLAIISNLKPSHNQPTMLTSMCLAGFAAIASTALAAPHASTSECSAVSFNIAATAENAVLSPSYDPNNETSIIGFINAMVRGEVNPVVGTQEISGSFVINGIYCRPTRKVKKRRDALQILVHGITYNSTMWGGYHFGDRYNWHAYANAEGYHTLAIDRLGHGLNSKALDPNNVVQPSLQVEIYRQLIQSIRSTATNSLQKRFSNIIYVGHSYGSQIALPLARLYPELTSALVLTGWTSTTNLSEVQKFNLASASSIYPLRFPGLAKGYLAMVDEALRKSLFYYGGFDPAIPAFDFANQDIVTVGEFAANAGPGGLFSIPPENYTKPVMVITGVEDFVFCVQPGVPPRECEKLLEKSKTDIFPGVPARKYEYFAPRNTGHDLTLHYSAPETFKRAHKFLNKYF
ncbi:retinal pigment epithelial membrane protein-domain-containing protein [Triangularia verruculosa]|uniref:Retinal pigment epithelial membrane protein-domain-containing protein n=1 Tax=Triangularia verruculosa TaxID=2587418 RepID=A0AAN7ARZ3_9PEZI|nr:retinal pigment epithelial membrane protein-domain-containing protein [Triangularia verruculosa]